MSEMSLFCLLFVNFNLAVKAGTFNCKSVSVRSDLSGTELETCR